MNQSNHRFSRLIGLLAVVTLLIGCGEAETESTRNPVVFIGVDGATWDIIEPMMDRGELPNFKSIRERGAWGPLITVGPQVSPVVWTTFATGRFGRAHDILDFTYPYTPGPKKPVESSQRRQAAMWNIASDAGLSVDVVGYFASYPAETINGVLASDRIFKRIDGSVAPAEALDKIAPQLDWHYRLESQEQLWERYFHWDYNPRPSDESHPNYEADWMVAGRVDGNIVGSEYLRVITNYLLDENQRDLFITYFRTPDYASHSLYWYFRDEDYAEKPDPHIKKLLGDVLPETYRFIDDVLGDILDRVPDNANIIIVSDHGSGSATGRYVIKDEAMLKKLTGNHRPVGIVLAAGPDIAPGRIDGLTIMEIFPAVMALLDLPISDELPGELDYRLFREGYFEQHPIQTVSHYPFQQTEVQATTDEQAQVETVQSLKGLGYVGEGFELGDRDASDADFWQTEANLLASHLTGELVYWILRDDVSTAISVLSMIWKERPDVAVHMPSRAQTEFEAIAEQLAADALPESAMVSFRQQAAALRKQFEAASEG
jgi:hypothetical protein